MAIGLGMLGPAGLRADPPKVTALVPTGVQQGQTATITAQGTFPNWPVSVWSDTPGIDVTAVADKKGTFQVAAGAGATPGIAWLRFHDAEGASSLRPLFVGTLPELQEKEPNDSADKAQKIEQSAAITGQLAKRGDVDEFAIELQAGQTCVAAMYASDVLGSPMDGVIQVASPDGFVLAQQDDERGLDPQLAFTAPRAGTYLVRVFAFPATPDSSISFAGGDAFHYRLTLCTGPYLDHVFPLAIPAGQSVECRLFGWNLPPEWSPVAVTGSGGRVTWVHHPQAAHAFPLEPIDLPPTVEQEDASP